MSCTHCPPYPAPRLIRLVRQARGAHEGQRTRLVSSARAKTPDSARVGPQTDQYMEWYGGESGLILSRSHAATRWLRPLMGRFRRAGAPLAGLAPARSVCPSFARLRRYAASRNAARFRFARSRLSRARSARCSTSPTMCSKPSAPRTSIRPKPRYSRLLIADSTAACVRRAARNAGAPSRSRSALDRRPFRGSAFNSSTASSRSRLAGL